MAYPQLWRQLLLQRLNTGYQVLITSNIADDCRGKLLKTELLNEKSWVVSDLTTKWNMGWMNDILRFYEKIDLS